MPTRITVDSIGSSNSDRSHSIPVALPSHTKAEPPDRASDPQGLTLLHEPREPPVADIIFIHGLGGSSRLSWSDNKDLQLFWPREWLPLDREVGKARLFTFGYNAFFHSPSQASAVGISDFAKSLLYDLLYGSDHIGDNFNIGNVSLWLEFCTWYYF